MLKPEAQQFIERTGVEIERLGMSRTFGRLFGLLMVADRPLSLDDLAEQLHVSKASVSYDGHPDEGPASTVDLRMRRWRARGCRRTEPVGGDADCNIGEQHYRTNAVERVLVGGAGRPPGALASRLSGARRPAGAGP